MPREKAILLRLSDTEYEELQLISEAHDRSMSSYIRSLIRREVNKSIVEIAPRKTKKAAEATA